MTVEEIGEWGEFAVALGSAGAVLAGLIFVAVTMNIDRILRVRGLPGRAGESVILYLSVLIECTFLLVPGQPAGVLGAELLLAGLVTLGVLLAIAVPAVRRPNRQPRSWHIFRLVEIAAASVLAMLAGLSLLGAFGGGLYWLVASLLTALLAATGNAWVLLVEVVRDDRYTPVEQ